jgi:predicted Zn-ribbon and HTH transcriptional regulator
MYQFEKNCNATNSKGDNLPAMASASSKPIINSAERMLNLVALLTESNRPLTLEDIGNYMEHQYPVRAEARRTAFERDKKSLRKLGVPITMQVLGGNDAGKTAYSIDRTEYKLINFDLTEDELSALQQAAALVQIDTQWGKQAMRTLMLVPKNCLSCGPPLQRVAKFRSRITAVFARCIRMGLSHEMDSGISLLLTLVAKHKSHTVSIGLKM